VKNYNTKVYDSFYLKITLKFPKREEEIGELFQKEEYFLHFANLDLTFNDNQFCTALR
jgi:hypothetical protein